MQTYRIKIKFSDSRVHTNGSATGRSLLGHCDIQARTKGDAIIAAQKEAARRWELNQTEECLVRTEFL